MRQSMTTNYQDDAKHPATVEQQWLLKIRKVQVLIEGAGE